MRGQCSPPLPKKTKRGKPSPQKQEIEEARYHHLLWPELNLLGSEVEHKHRHEQQIEASKGSRDNGLAILVGVQDIFE